MKMRTSILHPCNPRNPRLILYFLASLIAVAVLWAYLTTIDVSVRARGIVRPEGDPVRVISGVAGRIETIYVEEGSAVRQGDPLIQLDPAGILLKKKAIETRVHFTELRLEDLQQQLDEASAIEEQSATVDALDRSAAEVAAHAGVENARLRYTRSGLLLEEGLIARQAYDEARMALAQAEADESRLSSKSIDLKRAQGEARLSDLISAATPYRAELAGLYHELEQCRSELDRLTITSPAGGQITSLASVHVGENLSAGAAIASLVPTSQAFVIQSWLPTSDRAFVNPGQLVRLQTDEYETFNGSVISISPDAQFNDSLSGAYRVTISPADDAPELQLGMTFQVHYITRQERLLWLLFEKIRRR